MATERKTIVKLNEVLPYVIFTERKKKSNCYKTIDGVRINMSSLRYQLFAKKGINCVCCGIEGKFFAIERSYAEGQDNRGGWHLNLYAINENKEEVLMTKDHIQPKSKGGKDTLDNFQTMCRICNATKGNTLEE